VNEFVSECRTEWRRLGVVDPVADDMAAELAADLEEAETEGTPIEQVLGADAFEPRAFAAAWAAERGLLRQRRVNVRLAAVAAAFALAAVVGGVLVLASAPSTSAGAPPVRPEPRLVWPRGTPPPWSGLELRVVAAPQALAAGNADNHDSGVDARAVGWIVVAVGLAGFAPLTLLSLRRARRRRRAPTVSQLRLLNGRPPAPPRLTG
jgi:hypothetical protein